MAAKNHTGTTLVVQENNGTYRTASSDEIIVAARSAINRRFRRGKAISSPAESQDFLKLRLAPLEHEVFAVLWLDNRHRFIDYEELFRGTIDGSSVHPREVVKSALRLQRRRLHPGAQSSLRCQHGLRCRPRHYPQARRRTLARRCAGPRPHHRRRRLPVLRREWPALAAHCERDALPVLRATAPVVRPDCDQKNAPTRGLQGAIDCTAEPITRLCWGRSGRYTSATTLLARRPHASTDPPSRRNHHSLRHPPESRFRSPCWARTAIRSESVSMRQPM